MEPEVPDVLDWLAGLVEPEEELALLLAGLLVVTVLVLSPSEKRACMSRALLSSRLAPLLEDVEDGMLAVRTVKDLSGCCFP